MKILYLSQYFPPEMGAPAARVSELACRWAQAGHDVQVLTGFPNHPTGVVPPQYRRKLRLRERWQGVDLLRTYVYATPNKGFAKRTASFLSFAASSVLLGAMDRRVRDCDVIVATSPQFFCAVAGWALSRVTGARFVLEIRDLWPESIVAVGLLPHRHPVTRTLEAIEQFLYRQADLLVSVTESFCEVWRAQGHDPAKMRVIKNGVDVSSFVPGERQGPARKTLGLRDEFVVSYIGTHGMAMKLEVLLDVAERLADEPDIRFLFVGEGAERQRLMADAATRGLSNVTFLGQQPREAIPELIAATDLVAVVLKKSPLFEKVIPSKIFEIFGCERPILLGVEGEAERLVRQSGGGYIVPPEDVDAMVERIREARDNPAERRRRARSGRDFVREHFDRDRLADEYLADLEELVGAGA